MRQFSRLKSINIMTDSEQDKICMLYCLALLVLDGVHPFSNSEMSTEAPSGTLDAPEKWKDAVRTVRLAVRESSKVNLEVDKILEQLHEMDDDDLDVSDVSDFDDDFFDDDIPELPAMGHSSAAMLLHEEISTGLSEKAAKPVGGLGGMPSPEAPEKAKQHHIGTYFIITGICGKLLIKLHRRKLQRAALLIQACWRFRVHMSCVRPPPERSSTISKPPPVAVVEEDISSGTSPPVQVAADSAKPGLRRKRVLGSTQKPRMVSIGVDTDDLPSQKTPKPRSTSASRPSTSTSGRRTGTPETRARPSTSSTLRSSSMGARGRVTRTRAKFESEEEKEKRLKEEKMLRLWMKKRVVARMVVEAAKTGEQIVASRQEAKIFAERPVEMTVSSYNECRPMTKVPVALSASNSCFIHPFGRIVTCPFLRQFQILGKEENPIELDPLELPPRVDQAIGVAADPRGNAIFMLGSDGSLYALDSFTSEVTHRLPCYTLRARMGRKHTMPSFRLEDSGPVAKLGAGKSTGDTLRQVVSVRCRPKLSGTDGITLCDVVHFNHPRYVCVNLSAVILDTTEEDDAQKYLLEPLGSLVIIDAATFRIIRTIHSLSVFFPPESLPADVPEEISPLTSGVGETALTWRYLGDWDMVVLVRMAGVTLWVLQPATNTCRQLMIGDSTGKESPGGEMSPVLSRQRSTFVAVSPAHAAVSQCPVLTLSPDGSWLSAGIRTASPMICMWSISRITECGTSKVFASRLLRGMHKAPVSSVMFSPDSLMMTTVDEDGIVCIWDARSRQHAVIQPDPDLVPYERQADFSYVHPAPQRTYHQRPWSCVGKAVLAVNPAQEQFQTGQRGNFGYLLQPLLFDAKVHPYIEEVLKDRGILDRTWCFALAVCVGDANLSSFCRVLHMQTKEIEVKCCEFDKLVVQYCHTPQKVTSADGQNARMLWTEFYQDVYESILRLCDERQRQENTRELQLKRILWKWFTLSVTSDDKEIDDKETLQQIYERLLHMDFRLRRQKSYKDFLSLCKLAGAEVFGLLRRQGLIGQGTQELSEEVSGEYFHIATSIGEYEIFESVVRGVRNGRNVRLSSFVESRHEQSRVRASIEGTETNDTGRVGQLMRWDSLRKHMRKRAGTAADLSISVAELGQVLREYNPVLQLMAGVKSLQKHIKSYRLLLSNVRKSPGDTESGTLVRRGAHRLMGDLRISLALSTVQSSLETLSSALRTAITFHDSLVTGLFQSWFAKLTLLTPKLVGGGEHSHRGSSERVDSPVPTVRSAYAESAIATSQRHWREYMEICIYPDSVVHVQTPYIPDDVTHKLRFYDATDLGHGCPVTVATISQYDLPCDKIIAALKGVSSHLGFATVLCLFEFGTREPVGVEYRHLDPASGDVESMLYGEQFNGHLGVVFESLRGFRSLSDVLRSSGCLDSPQCAPVVAHWSAQVCDALRRCCSTGWLPNRFRTRDILVSPNGKRLVLPNLLPSAIATYCHGSEKLMSDMSYVMYERAAGKSRVRRPIEEDDGLAVQFANGYMSCFIQSCLTATDMDASSIGLFNRPATSTAASSTTPDDYDTIALRNAVVGRQARARRTLDILCPVSADAGRLMKSDSSGGSSAALPTALSPVLNERAFLLLRCLRVQLGPIGESNLSFVQRFAAAAVAHLKSHQRASFPHWSAPILHKVLAAHCSNSTPALDDVYGHNATLALRLRALSFFLRIYGNAVVLPMWRLQQMLMSWMLVKINGRKYLEGLEYFVLQCPDPDVVVRQNIVHYAEEVAEILEETRGSTMDLGDRLRERIMRIDVLFDQLEKYLLCKQDVPETKSPNRYPLRLQDFDDDDMEEDFGESDEMGALKFDKAIRNAIIEHSHRVLHAVFKHRVLPKVVALVRQLCAINVFVEYAERSLHRLFLLLRKILKRIYDPDDVCTRVYTVSEKRSVVLAIVQLLTGSDLVDDADTSLESLLRSHRRNRWLTPLFDVVHRRLASLFGNRGPVDDWASDSFSLSPSGPLMATPARLSASDPIDVGSIFRESAQSSPTWLKRLGRQNSSKSQLAERMRLKAPRSNSAASLMSSGSGSGRATSDARFFMRMSSDRMDDLYHTSEYFSNLVRFEENLCLLMGDRSVPKCRSALVYFNALLEFVVHSSMAGTPRQTQVSQLFVDHCIPEKVVLLLGHPSVDIQLAAIKLLSFVSEFLEQIDPLAPQSDTGNPLVAITSIFTRRTTYGYFLRYLQLTTAVVDEPTQEIQRQVLVILKRTLQGSYPVLRTLFRSGALPRIASLLVAKAPLAQRAAAVLKAAVRGGRSEVLRYISEMGLHDCLRKRGIRINVAWSPQSLEQSRKDISHRLQRLTASTGDMHSAVMFAQGLHLLCVNEEFSRYYFSFEIHDPISMSPYLEFLTRVYEKCWEFAVVYATRQAQRGTAFKRSSSTPAASQPAEDARDPGKRSTSPSRYASPPRSVSPSRTSTLAKPLTQSTTRSSPSRQSGATGSPSTSIPVGDSQSPMARQQDIRQETYELCLSFMSGALDVVTTLLRVDAVTPVRISKWVDYLVTKCFWIPPELPVEPGLFDILHSNLKTLFLMIHAGGHHVLERVCVCQGAARYVYHISGLAEVLKRAQKTIGAGTAMTSNRLLFAEEQFLQLQSMRLAIIRVIVEKEKESPTGRQQSFLRLLADGTEFVPIVSGTNLLNQTSILTNVSMKISKPAHPIHDEAAQTVLLLVRMDSGDDHCRKILHNYMQRHSVPMLRRTSHVLTKTDPFLTRIQSFLSKYANVLRMRSTRTQ